MLKLDGSGFSYLYDAAYQLTEEKRVVGMASSSTDYTYDPVGNRLTKTDLLTGTTNHTYNPANELTVIRPSSGFPTTQSWDANGNLIGQNTGGSLTTYSWDDENRMTGIVFPDASIETHLYSADGKRQRWVSGADTSVMTWDEDNLLTESDVNLVTQVQYTDWPGVWGCQAAPEPAGRRWRCRCSTRYSARARATRPRSRTRRCLRTAHRPAGTHCPKPTQTEANYKKEIPS